MGVVLSPGSAFFVRGSYFYRFVGHKPTDINMVCHKGMANATSPALYQGIEPFGTFVFNLWLCLDFDESFYHPLQNERNEYG